jgi:glycosyltransferase involved in cell wall biosynthesis
VICLDIVEGDGRVDFVTRLALVMIARDEAKVIARALNSAKPYVDRMIVLDTGSVDATREIAAACGAEIQLFQWCDDFAAARNAALAHSDADWNLVLDADEWLDGGFEGLGPDILPPGGGGFLGAARVRSLIDHPPGAAGLAWISRVLPRGVGYRGRIHEQPSGALPVRRLPLDIGHDGYSQESLARKGARNEILMMRELEAAPEDPYLWFQMGKEHQARKHHPQAALCFAEAMRLAPADAPYRHPLIVRTLTALRDNGQLAEALILADAEASNWETSPDFYLIVGYLYLDAAAEAPSQAKDHFLPIAESAWRRCLEIGERPDLEGAISGSGGHIAARNLAFFHDSLGDPQTAAEYRVLAERLRAQTPDPQAPRIQPVTKASAE